MKNNFSKAILLIIYLCFQSNLFAQEFETVGLSDQELSDYRNQSKRLIKFLEYSLNMLGGQKTSTKDKEIIINESYLKFFKDETVQIEDDLDENRQMLINKDIQAYLKDIDFFFKSVTFTFTIDTIELQENKSEGFYFFKATTNRNLQGITIDNQSVNNNKTRYIEINIDSENKLLKIASIYTTKISEEQDLKSWWSNLSREWRDIFEQFVTVKDSITYKQLKKLKSLTELNVVGEKKIKDLLPVSKLINLRKLDCSETRITELTPLRNLSKLANLNCSRTIVSDLEPLRNLSNLQKLYCSDTKISSLAPLENLENMKEIDISENTVTTLEPLQQLQKLEKLLCNNTKISSLDPVKNLSLIAELNCRNTQITELISLPALADIDFSNTKVRSLKALMNLKNIKTVSCNKTYIKEAEIQEFIEKKPDCLVIYKTEELDKWWNALPDEWRKAFREKSAGSESDRNQWLHKLVKMESLNISNNENIISLLPVAELKKLRDLNCSHTKISSLEPVKNLLFLEKLRCDYTLITDIQPVFKLVNLKYLDVENTEVTDLSPLQKLQSLVELNCKNTAVSSLSYISGLKNLERLYCDETHISNEEFDSFINTHPDCLVIYKSDELMVWWSKLSRDWKTIFSSSVELSDSPTKEQLHKVVSIEKITIFGNSGIKNLEPIGKLTKLKELRIDDSRISNINPLSELSSLKILQISKCPANNLMPLKGILSLEVLDCSNTQVDNLEAVAFLKNLEELNCSGTQISMIGLNPLESLKKLEKLDCSNTSVRMLKPLYKCRNLKELKCYNTKLLKMTVDMFKKEFRNCDVVFY